MFSDDGSLTGLQTPSASEEEVEKARQLCAQQLEADIRAASSQPKIKQPQMQHWHKILVVISFVNPEGDVPSTRCCVTPASRRALFAGWGPARGKVHSHEVLASHISGGHRRIGG